MRVLVAVASRHGATRGIAERIAGTLRTAGIDADLQPAASVRDVAQYDAFVVGSASYMFHWLKEGADLVRRHRSELAAKPVWLFSSGPLGTEPLDAQGRDQKEAAVPKEMAELRESVGARDHRVFFGAYERDRRPIGLAERLVSVMPAARDALPAGDFRDWPEIEAWAEEIADALQHTPMPAGLAPGGASR
jgi:menaquinone-dependent protoporphyrinogen oxidase